MTKQVADLSVKELERLIEKAIKRELQSLMLDPDYGLELRDTIKRRLKSSLASKKRIPFEEVKQRIGLSRYTE
jgi:ABC-type glutathione transport system ATPase component